MPNQTFLHSHKNTDEDMVVQNFKPVGLETTLVDPFIFESVMETP